MDDASQLERLRSELALLRRLINASTDAVFAIEFHSGRFSRVNDRACLSLGYSREELLGMGVADIDTRIPDGETWRRNIRKFETDVEQVFESEHRRRDGTTFAVEINSRLVDTDQGRLLISIARDITVRRAAEAEKDRLITELRAALAEIQTLQGIIPICMYCKEIRDDKGYWNQVEKYIALRQGSSFTHGICPRCAKERFPDLDLTTE
jgi:PAS domain S-box-containing protein